MSSGIWHKRVGKDGGRHGDSVDSWPLLVLFSIPVRSRYRGSAFPEYTQLMRCACMNCSVEKGAPEGLIRGERRFRCVVSGRFGLFSLLFSYLETHHHIASGNQRVSPDQQNNENRLVRSVEWASLMLRRENANPS